jgi:hypothetical protein
MGRGGRQGRGGRLAERGQTCSLSFFHPPCPRKSAETPPCPPCLRLVSESPRKSAESPRKSAETPPLPLKKMAYLTTRGTLE